MSMFVVPVLRRPTHAAVKFKPEIHRIYTKKNSIVSSDTTKSASKTKDSNASFEGFVAVWLTIAFVE